MILNLRKTKSLENKLLMDVSDIWLFRFKKFRMAYEKQSRLQILLSSNKINKLIIIESIAMKHVTWKKYSICIGSIDQLGHSGQWGFWCTDQWIQSEVHFSWIHQPSRSNVFKYFLRVQADNKKPSQSQCLTACVQAKIGLHQNLLWLDWKWHWK